jgi:hypothetical protein
MFAKKKSVALAIAATLALAVPLFMGTTGIAYAGDIPCPPPIVTGFNNNVDADKGCVINIPASDKGNGNVKLEEAGDDVNFNSGFLNGNIECKDSGNAAGGISVGTGTSMNGNVKAENCGTVFIGGATIRSNVEVKDGNADLSTFDGPLTQIFGNVKHEGSGACTVSVTLKNGNTADGEIRGNVEGCIFVP